MYIYLTITPNRPTIHQKGVRIQYSKHTSLYAYDRATQFATVVLNVKK